MPNRSIDLMKFPTLALLLSSLPVSALTIKIDYTYDTANFFNTPERKSAIEAVAKFYGDLIQDNLLRIDATQFPQASWTAEPAHPATGATIQIVNLVVPENTIIVYVGSRNLSGNTLGVGGPGGWGAGGFQPWFDRLEGRGSAGALAAVPTDHCPWGGSIAFDADSTWNFSQSQNQAGFEFVTVALHEMGHVLGIGTAASWTNKISGAVFNGAASIRSNGTAPPVQASGGHYGGTSLVSDVFGSFGRTHGTSRPVLMLASSTDNGSSFDVASDLDLAGLVDCGWEIRPRLELSVVSLKPSAVSFTWKSSSFLDYKVQRGTSLQLFPDGSGVIAGNGSIATWTDPSPPASKAFYRLRTTRPAGIPAPAALPAAIMVNGGYMTYSEDPKFATGCYD